MQLETPRRRLQVDAFPERHKPHPEGLQLLQQRHQVLEAPPQAIQPPDDDRVHFPPSRIGDQTIEGGTAIRGPADAVVDELTAGPASGVDVAAQLGELILGLLVEGRDARVDGGLHDPPPASVVPAFRI